MKAFVLPRSSFLWLVVAVLSLILYDCPSSEAFERYLLRHAGCRRPSLGLPRITVSTIQKMATTIGREGDFRSPFNGQAPPPPPPPNAQSQDNGLTVNPKRTYYNILGVPPDATREAIKQRYIALAKEYHPDAQIGKPADQKVPEQLFSEIASAWKILSNKKDRMRYDRSLQAAAFANDISAFVSTMGQQAGPPARRIFEELAVPFLRRSAATTVASFTAVSNNLKNGTNVNLGDAVVSAIQAGQIASNVVDSIELSEQAEELERRAMLEVENAAKAKAELSAIVEKRLLLTLRTPNSEITSTDALKILDGFNTLDSLSLMERAMWKQPLEHGIRELEEAETEFQIKRQVQKQTQLMHQQLINSYQREEQNARMALEAEERARKAYEAAQRLVMDTKQALANTTKSLLNAEAAAKRSFNELERVSLQLSRRQEKVRKTLRKKEETVRERHLLQFEQEQLKQQAREMEHLAPLYSLTCDGDDEEVCLADMEECRKEEQRLARESARLEDMANRFKMRAARLWEKAEMKRQQYANNNNNNNKRIDKRP